MLLHKTGHLGEERRDRTPAVAAELAPDQIERLDAVRAFVDHRDAGVAYELLHTVLADIAVAAEHLLRRYSVGKPGIGEHAFDHGGHETHVVFRRLARLLVLRAMLNVAL